MGKWPSGSNTLMLQDCRISQSAGNVKCLNDPPTCTLCVGLPAHASFFYIDSPALSYKVCPRYCQWLTVALMALTLAVTGDRPNTLHHRTVFKRPVISLLFTPVMPSGVKFTLTDVNDGFGGLVLSMLASGSRVRGFEPYRSRWIFSDVKKSSACLPSEAK
jgi:hypothetical protein